MEGKYTELMFTPISLMNKKELLNKLEVLLGSQKKEKHYIITPNPEIVQKSLKDRTFRNAVQKASFSLADGIGLIFALKYLFGVSVAERITGSSFTWDLLALAEKKNLRVALLGGEVNVAKKAEKKIKEKYPQINIVYAKSGLHKNEDVFKTTEYLKELKNSKPQIIFVALGAPKQEIWMHQHLNKIPSAKLAIGVGGTLDFISGKKKRAPLFLRNLGLEWFFRLIQEPKRIHRIFSAVIVFPIKAVHWKFKTLFHYRKGVVMCVFSKDLKKLLLVQGKFAYKGHLQMPQGGLEEGENLKKGAFRELEEEICSTDFELLFCKNKFHQYDAPKRFQMACGQKGQKQGICFFRYLKEDATIELPQEGELKSYKWIDLDKLERFIKPPRKESILRAIEIYKKETN